MAEKAYQITASATLHSVSCNKAVPKSQPSALSVRTLDYLCQLDQLALDFSVANSELARKDFLFLQVMSAGM